MYNWKPEILFIPKWRIHSPVNDLDVIAQRNPIKTDMEIVEMLSYRLY